jgi:arylformamidase
MNQGVVYIVKIIDISLPLSAGTLLWPGSPEFELNQYKQLKAGDDCNNSRLACDVHTGTHIDAPSHFLLNGATIETLSLDVLIGPAVVCCLPSIPSIRADDLESLSLPLKTKRLLLRTDNSELWNAQVHEFRRDYVGLTYDAAQWIAERGIRLVGIDYLSVARFEETEAVHRTLLGAGIVLLEGINLYGAQAKEYELICLPLKLMRSEGAPARAVLREMS